MSRRGWWPATTSRATAASAVLSAARSSPIRASTTSWTPTSAYRRSRYTGCHCFPPRRIRRCSTTAPSWAITPFQQPGPPPEFRPGRPFRHRRNATGPRHSLFTLRRCSHCSKYDEPQLAIESRQNKRKIFFTSNPNCVIKYPPPSSPPSSSSSSSSLSFHFICLKIN